MLYWRRLEARDREMSTVMSGKKVLVTGGAGFLGKYVTAELKQLAPREIIVPRSRDWDLRDPHVSRKLLEKFRPEIVIHLAASVGGIGANKANPGKFFYENASMGIHLIENARLCEVEKIVVIGTVCSYPKHTPTPFDEDNLWNGYPEETNAPYGIAKKALLVQCQAYREQYGMNAVYLIPVNLYGPGDDVDPESSHVIPGLIRKFVEARRQGSRMVTAWGTGAATREFLHIRDCARGIVAATDRYDSGEPINLGSGEEISIRDLTNLIRKETGFTGTVRWDASKPDGQPRRCLDTTRALEAFGWRAEIPFPEGLRETIEWYERETENG